MPSHVSPDIASEILREISASLRQRKGDFPCYFVSDMATFALPAGTFSSSVFDELTKEIPVVVLKTSSNVAISCLSKRSSGGSTFLS